MKDPCSCICRCTCTCFSGCHSLWESASALALVSVFGLALVFLVVILSEAKNLLSPVLRPHQQESKGAASAVPSPPPQHPGFSPWDAIMPNWLRRKNPLSVEEAALTLHLQAISGLDEPCYPNSLNAENNMAVNTLVYLTRSAATILALHVEELKPKGAARAKEILTAFENKAFPKEPTENDLALVHDVREIMKLVQALRTLPSTKSNAELLQQFVSWGEVWLATIPQGDVVFSDIGKLSTSMLVGRLVTDFNSIDLLVSNAVYGR